MIDDHLSNITEIDVASLDRGDMRWVNYDSSVSLNDFEKAHSCGSSDSYILQSTSDPDLYMGIRREDFFQSLLSMQSDSEELLFSARMLRLVARMKGELHAGTMGAAASVHVGINVNKQHKNFCDAMSREDRQEWAVAYDSEYQGFLNHGTLKLVLPQQGAKGDRYDYAH